MSETGFLELFGGVACLDFANTVDGRATAQPEELVHSYADLARWSAYAGLIDAPTAGWLSRISPGETDEALATALELRDAIFGVFAAIGSNEPLPAAHLAVLQRAFAEAMSVARLVPGGTGFGWEFTGVVPDRAWWPVAVSAVELLTSGPLDRVKVCAAEEGCQGLFLDTSKNRSRRWCSMGACGVEAKVQRQAVRRRRVRPLA